MPRTESYQIRILVMGEALFQVVLPSLETLSFLDLQRIIPTVTSCFKKQTALLPSPMFAIQEAAELIGGLAMDTKSETLCIKSEGLSMSYTAVLT
jgi:hypothetical protein